MSRTSLGAPRHARQRDPYVFWDLQVVCCCGALLYHYLTSCYVRLSPEAPQHSVGWTVPSLGPVDGIERVHREPFCLGLPPGIIRLAGAGEK